MDRVEVVGCDGEPLGPPEDARRIVGWLCGGRGHGDVWGRAWFRRRRVNPLPIGADGIVRHQAPTRPGSARPGPSRCLEWAHRVRSPRPDGSRRVAVFLDVTADHVPDGGFLAALDRPPAPLRIAVSFKPPPGSFARLTDECRQAIEHTAVLLCSMGHDVFEQQVDYGFDTMWNASVRYIKGLEHDVATMARPDRLERNTRHLATLGRWLPDNWLATARRRERAIAERMNQSFDHADVVMTPIAGGPAPHIAEVTGRGLIRSLYQSNAAAWAVPWNVIGQPAASVPIGVDSHGLPLAVQLCGRPRDEAVLLSLAAQIEEARPWTRCQPPVDPLG